MTRLETKFSLGGDLIIVEVVVTGPHRRAAMTTIAPEIADAIGYSARDGTLTSVHSAVSKEHGYSLHAAEIAALGISLPNCRVNVFDLGYDDIDGLLGMSFLRELNFEIRPDERRILAQRIERP